MVSKQKSINISSLRAHKQKQFFYYRFGLVLKSFKDLAFPKNDPDDSLSNIILLL